MGSAITRSLSWSVVNVAEQWYGWCKDIGDGEITLQTWNKGWLGANDYERLPVETTGAHVESGDHVHGEYHNHLNFSSWWSIIVFNYQKFSSSSDTDLISDTKSDEFHRNGHSSDSVCVVFNFPLKKKTRYNEKGIVDEDIGGYLEKIQFPFNMDKKIWIYDDQLWWHKMKWKKLV